MTTKALIKSIVVLAVICLVISGALAVVNSFTAPIITAAAIERENASRQQVLPAAANFEEIASDAMPATITGAYKVAPLIGTVYNESTSSITATLKKCDVENVVVTATSYDFCTTGMVAFVHAGDADAIAFENCSVKNVKLYAPNSYTAHAAVYTTGSETLFNEANGVTVTDVTFENK